MNAIGNLLWLIFGGFFSAIAYFVIGVLYCLTIIGIPFGVQCIKIGYFVLLPFGKKIITHERANGCLYILFNILWIITGGLYTALVHLFFGVLLSITIIGIPFGRQHFKMASLSLAPFGKDVVYR